VIIMKKRKNGYSAIIVILIFLFIMAPVALCGIDTSVGYGNELITIQPAVNQTKPGDITIDFTEFERTLQEELNETNTPGAAVVIVSGDKIIYAKGFGVSNVETGAPVTTDMLFRIGSITKVLTAATLVSLADEGKIDLDEPIGNYVSGLSPGLANITGHQLLSHTAGLIDAASSYGLHDDSALANTVRSWNDSLFFTEPEDIFSYSNPGYSIAGFTVEEVGGRYYADAVDDLLFKPLGMNRTTFRPTMAMTYPLSQGHIENDEGTLTVVRPFTDNVEIWPSGSAFSNVIDFSRFVIAFMNNGSIEGEQVLSPSVISELSTPRADVSSFAEDAKYGLGLFIYDYRGLRVVGHGGDINGFRGVFRMVPDHRFAVIIFANSNGRVLDRPVEKAFELMLPLEAEVKPQGEVSPISEAEMAQYVGTYCQYPELCVEIFEKDGNLFLNDSGTVSGPITKIGDYRFSALQPGDPQPLEFMLVPGPDERITYLLICPHALKKVLVP
jgi:CubicO group peptidase (beta-lactamase class C family)